MPKFETFNILIIIFNLKMVNIHGVGKLVEQARYLFVNLHHIWSRFNGITFFSKKSGHRGFTINCSLYFKTRRSLGKLLIFFNNIILFAEKG